MKVSEKKLALERALSNHSFTPTTLSHHRTYLKLLLSRRFSEFLFVILLQGFNVFFDYGIGQYSPIALGASINLILVFWRGYYVLPGLLLGSLSFALLTGASLWQSCLFSLLCTGQPAAVVYLTRRWVGPLIPFAKLKHWTGFSVICFVVLACSLNLHWQIFHSMKFALQTLAGYLLLVPANLIWGSYPFIHKVLPTKKFKLTLAFCLLSALAVLLSPFLPFLLLAIPPIAIACGLRSGLYGCALLNLSLSLGFVFVAVCLNKPLDLGMLSNENTMTAAIVLLANLSLIPAIHRSAARGLKP